MAEHATPLDDVGFRPGSTPERHTCYPRQNPKQHCDTCNVDGLLIRLSKSMEFTAGGFELVMSSMNRRTACYCGCSHGG